MRSTHLFNDDCSGRLCLEIFPPDGKLYDRQIESVATQFWKTLVDPSFSQSSLVTTTNEDLLNYIITAPFFICWRSTNGIGVALVLQYCVEKGSLPL